MFPWADGTCAATPEPGSTLALDCETGLGTAVFVTGTFGLIAAGEIVRHISGAPPTSLPKAAVAPAPVS